jgi:hypothetical protein
MFNRTYQLRAVKKAGGGRKLARSSMNDASLSLPWAGIFRPREPWRAAVLIARAAEAVGSDVKAADAFPFHRPEPPVRAGIASTRRKNRNRELQGIQLSLFPERDERFYHPPVPQPVAVRISAHDLGLGLGDTVPSAPAATNAITPENPITDEDVPF